MSQLTFSEYWSQLTPVGKVRLAHRSGVHYKYLSAIANDPDRKPSTMTLAKLNKADRRITLKMMHPEIWGE